MKKTDYGFELESKVEIEAFIDTLEKSAKKSELSDVLIKKNDEILLIINDNYEKIDISSNKIYFLSHPCTSGGWGEKGNREHEEAMYQFILSQNKNAKVIRPLKIIPDNMDYDDAMEICYRLMDISDVAIFSPEFQTSTGCKDEHKYSFDKKISRLYIISERRIWWKKID